MKKVAVLGAGVMGATIAAHFANAGAYVYLLDQPTGKDGGARNHLAQKGKDRLSKERPSPIFHKERLHQIQVGNFEDHWKWLQEVDWIIEVVVESLEIKQRLFKQIDQVWVSGTIVSSNTSGISIEEMVKDRSEEFKRHFLGTHFFNPPRYMKLLEIIPNSSTDPNIIQRVKDYAERFLGKGVVMAKDTPNFIANRIGTYGMQVTFTLMDEMGLGIDEVDTITGPAIARPKSATFRTLDLVGLDTYRHVVSNMHQLVEGKEKEAFRLHPLIRNLVEEGRFGAKSGKGFYKKKGRQILVLDPETMTYRERRKMKAPSLDRAKRARSLSERLQVVIYADDPAGKLAWELTKKILLYSAERVNEISHDLVSIDQAMRWGFQWELGPFELWDAIGVRRSVSRMKQENEKIPGWVEELLRQGKENFYESNSVYTPHGEFQPLPHSQRTLSLSEYKKQGVIRGNAGATLIDIGDGIALLEFHSPKQAIGADMIQMIQQAEKEIEANYRALIVGGTAPNFCVGANLMFMLMQAQDQDWMEIDLMIRQFQQAMGSLRTTKFPVVVAPYGMTLGGGVELCLPADHIQASAETYMGLVEVGVGLIPGGGGCKEMLLRYTEGIDPKQRLAFQPQVNEVFRVIAQAKVSSSAEEARQYRFLRASDGVTMNQDHLLFDAKQAAIHLANTAYQSPKPKKITVVGETGYNVLKLGAYQLYQSGYISKHDRHIANKLAYVLAGGGVPEGTEVSEAYLLDLEREAFLSLIGEPKTQARMQHMLTHGKPLRN